jgi:hypothetical protein
MRFQSITVLYNSHQGKRTIIRVLTSNFGDRVSDLVSHVAQRLAAQAGNQFLSDHNPLVWIKGREHVFAFTASCVFYCFCGYPSKENGGE